jgi:hypothetical protein
MSNIQEQTRDDRCSFSRIGVKVWNCIPLKIRKLSKNIFEKEMKSSLRDIFCEEDSYLDTPSIIKKKLTNSKNKNSVFQLRILYH